MYKHRTVSSGGGVGLYLAEILEFKFRADLVFTNENCAESLFVEVPRPKGKNLIIGVIHRPPKTEFNGFCE